MCIKREARVLTERTSQRLGLCDNPCVLATFKSNHTQAQCLASVPLSYNEWMAHTALGKTAGQHHLALSTKRGFMSREKVVQAIGRR